MTRRRSMPLRRSIRSKSRLASATSGRLNCPRWLAELGKADLETLKQYVDILPEHLVRRFISAEKDAVVVSGRIPDVDASQLLPVVQKLDAALHEVRKAHPGYEIAVTGLSGDRRPQQR